MSEAARLDVAALVIDAEHRVRGHIRQTPLERSNFLSQLADRGIQGALPLHFFLERYAEAYKAEMYEYVRCLENGAAVPVGGNDGMLSLKIGLAAIKSFQENRPIKLEEIN